MTDLHRQITDLEAEIDDLSEVAERCRKSMIVAQVMIVGGLLMFVVPLLGLIMFGPLALVGGIAATLAGIGFYGSSMSTREQTIAKIRTCEARRDELIDGMSLREVEAP